MILHSIVPAETVFNGYGGVSDINCFEATYRGEKVVVARMKNGQCVISRLLSTKPSSYLDPAFQPGSIVPEDELK
ncbi:MAG: hypothetical protein GX940_07600 [Clostridiaceae bacterium]|nr:hypothetical protein [Clostridiaceae bacterium]